jgi:branched-chain amino acid transport system substrate-binding protein
MRRREAAFRTLLFLIITVIVGCGGPPPAPTPVPTLPPVTVLPEPITEEPFAEDIRDLDEAPEEVLDETERLRLALAAAEDPAEAADLRMELAERLEGEGQTEEAVVLYVTLSGVAPESRHGTRAWDGVARIRETEGDAAGAARAQMQAWELADPGERSGRTSDLRRALARLETPEVRALSRETYHLRSHEQVEAELADRGDTRPGPGDPFPVAVLAPFTGRFERFGSAFVLGARIALDDRDAPPPDSIEVIVPEGRPPVTLLVRDTEGDLLAATNHARAVILEERARAILGPLLSVTSIGAGTVAQSFGVPLVAPTATDPGVSEIGRFVLTLDRSPRELAEPLAEFSVNSLLNSRHGVLVPQDRFAEDLEREFRRAVEERGGEVVVTVSYAPGRTDFRRLLERIDDAGVDAVYMPGATADLEKLAPQLEFYEFRRRILGHGGWMSPRVLDAGNLALEGGIFAVPRAEHPDSDFTRHLRREVWHRTGEELGRFHVEGYRAMSVLLAAVDLGARSEEEIVETLRQREHWRDLPPGERVDVVTFRDGALGPAAWAVGFDLTPLVRPEDREEEEEAVQPGEADSAAVVE